MCEGGVKELNDDALSTLKRTVLTATEFTSRAVLITSLSTSIMQYQLTLTKEIIMYFQSRHNRCNEATLPEA